ncbi:uncharacterized protein LOC103713146 isoform X2 [Phoenix dactylifera]|uniref:Uncharacterized protein LOC103713146 isoform X2 n=1 Tax=Phoenix dactylifera TaxID=42345 RepID=A0A8B9AQX4_PHODC|nr:uncharacterized protein LOC103713146 isoform X2 [Phoenix dactylifera]
MCGSSRPMEKRGRSHQELVSRWECIQREQEDDDPSPEEFLRIKRAKERWFSDCFDFLVNLPNESHIWCSCSELMRPLLETFHDYFNNSPCKVIWKRISRELRHCTQCIWQHHQAQETYSAEYELDTVDPLLKVLYCLDEERITEHLKEINAGLLSKEYDPQYHGNEVVSVMFEVLTYPILLDDQSLVNEFQIFLEAIDKCCEVTLTGNHQYLGVYALLFFKSGRARAIGLRLAGRMGKLKSVTDLEPLQPLLRKYIWFLETEVIPSTLGTSRSRVQLERINVWLGMKTLLGFLEAPAFEDGILEKYPVFLSIILNHVSDDTPEFSSAIACLRVSFEMLGCKLWLRTTISPSMMCNTLLGQCFHTRNEKSHKEIFDLFLPFLQSLEALQDGEHEKQRRHFLYFLLHQVTQSSNFSLLTRKNACKIALLIVHRGYIMNPPCPPFECAHMWGPSLVSSLKDSSLHSSLRQPAFDLINTIMISDASALISLKLQYHSVSKDNMSISADFFDDEDELHFSHDIEEKDYSCWNFFGIQSKLTSRECKEWTCVPALWFDALIKVDPSILPISFSKAVFWALAHISMLESMSSVELSLSVDNWLSSYAGEISSSLMWEVPNGSDDGGDGNETRNSVKASSMCILLIRTFKRFAAHFVMQIEHRELQKQWTWEPRMAESLILLLIDPNDIIRQVDRVILEHVSNTRGLTSGLQFLCSSASSLSAMFLGMRFALKQIQADSFLGNFHDLHHLFFVMRKLLKEVVTSQKSPISQDLNSAKFVSEGGFLRQPCSDYLSVRPGNSAIVVVTKSWEKFCYLLSAIMWPSILKCLEEGKELVNSKNCQMTCVRLLEALPVVYERVSSSANEWSGSSGSMVPEPDIFDIRWLSDLVDWGRSSLLVISRHWKQCMFALLNVLQGSHGGTAPCTIDAIEAIISQVAVDELKDKIYHLTISLHKETSRSILGKALKTKPLLPEPSFAKGSPAPENRVCGNQVLHTKGKEPTKIIEGRDVIIVSDDEAEKAASPNVAGKELPSDDSMVFNITSCSRNIFEPVVPRTFVKDTQVSSQKQDNDTQVSCRAESSVSGRKTSPIPLIGIGIGIDKQPHKLSDVNDIAASLKKASSSSRLVHYQSSAQTIPSLEPEKGNVIIEDLIHDAEDDPLECALSNSKRPKLVLTKPSISAPKRQVVPLQLPIKNKMGFLSRKDMAIRRLKPPRLDDWYKPILEMDYFAVVGLCSANEVEDTASVNLREVPLCFQSPKHYVEIFRPLALEEFKAQLHNSYIESSSDDMSCGSLCILSVERIDDFHLVRCRPEKNESLVSRGCVENDLVLLTKEPLQKSSQHVHVLGKVERREKSDKSWSIILVIRFYLPNGSSRLNKVRRFLIERSKWFLSRLMSITPQLREFQALSSLHDIPMLPIILNPVDGSLGYPESGKVQLSKLSQAMQKMLMSSFNDSQLQAISVAIRKQDSRRNFELSLIQGPPGTGKTRTIVAVVSALLALPTMCNNYSSKIHNSGSSTNNITCSNPRTQISQTAAVARAWQDAAFAKQMIKDAEEDSSRPTERPVRGRVLICAQSNAAVDELVSRVSQGLYGNDGKLYKPYIVRVGNAKTVHPSSLPYFIDTLVEQRLVEGMKNQTDAKNDIDVEPSSALRAKLEKVVDTIRYYEAKRAKLEDGHVNTNNSLDNELSKEEDAQKVSDVAIGAKLNILYGQKKAICGELASSQAREKKVSDESRSLRHNIRKSILREAEIVVTTLSGCGGDIYGVCSESASCGRFGNFSEQTLFDVVVIDEAAQALEPATLIPLQLLKSNGTKCVMVGDPKQLPATVLSNVASKFLFECSMFERLQRAGHPVIMLTEQYRMHPEISKFPSLHFYENKLLNGAQMANRTAAFHENACLGPYMFFDIADGYEHPGKNSGSLSLYNEFEADAAVEILKVFKKRYPSEFVPGRIGIITPYRSQLSLLRSRFSSAFGPEIISDMEFNTVDGFQGREVDILVLSTVRASNSNAKPPIINSSGIGFVADVRRMNVALTRAKYSLWVVSNARTLKRNLHWAALIQNSKERNLFISVERPYKSIFGKALSSSRENVTSSMLDLHSSKPKQGQRCKDVSSGDQPVNVKAREQRGKTKLIDGNLETHASRCSHDRYLTSLKGTRNSKNSGLSGGGVLQQEYRCPKDMASTIERHEGKKPHKQNDKLAKTEDTLKKNPVCERTGGRIKVNVPLETDSISSLIKKAKEAQTFSEHPKSSSSSHKDSLTLPSSGNGNNIATDTNKSKLSKLAEQKDMITRRKRQREAVDALLSSALISSKKPETSSKPVPVKKPPSDAAAI